MHEDLQGPNELAQSVTIVVDQARLDCLPGGVPVWLILSPTPPITGAPDISTGTFAIGEPSSFTVPASMLVFQCSQYHQRKYQAKV